MLQIELKKQRELRGISQQELSEVLGVSQGAVGLWESGKRKPSYKTLMKIAEYFGVTIDFLLGSSSTTTAESSENIDSLQLFAELCSQKQEKEAAAFECDSLREEAINLFDRLPEQERNQALSYLRFLSSSGGK